MVFDAQQGFRLGDRTVYPALNRIVAGDDELTVEGKVMDVLVALALRPGAVFPKNDLLDNVWPNQAVSDGVLVRAIHELRGLLGDSPHDPRYIETVPRVGYRLLQPPAPIEPSKKLDRPGARWHLAATLIAVVTVCATAWQFLGSKFGESPIDSVAVLPFANMTGDSGKDYVADGMTEEVIHLMAQQPRLHVAARTSSFLIRDKDLTVPEIGRQLNVDAIVEGSVRHERGTQRITVQLIHAASGGHRGSVTVDIREDDLFAAQQFLGEAIISMLDAAGADVDARVAETSRPPNALAYDLYLKARTKLHQRSAESLRDARALLDEATRLDPDLAPAHATLAQLYVVGRYYLGLPEAAAERKKVAAYQKALSLDPNNIDAIVVAATDAADRNDWVRAVQRFETALQLHPSNATAHLWYGQLLIMAGHIRKGRDHVAMAVHLDPLAGSTNTVMAFAAANFPHDERISTAAKQADQLGSRLAPRFLALHAFRQGDTEAFERELARAFDYMDIDPVAAEIIAAASRDSSQLQELASKLTPYGSLRNNFFARELALLGLHAEALAALMKHPRFEGTLASDVWLPEFRPMRELPEFPALLRSLGVDQYWATYGLPDVCRGDNPEAFCRHFANFRT